MELADRWGQDNKLFKNMKILLKMKKKVTFLENSYWSLHSLSRQTLIFTFWPVLLWNKRQTLVHLRIYDIKYFIIPVYRGRGKNCLSSKPSDHHFFWCYYTRISIIRRKILISVIFRKLPSKKLEPLPLFCTNSTFFFVLRKWSHVGT